MTADDALRACYPTEDWFQPIAGLHYCIETHYNGRRYVLYTSGEERHYLTKTSGEKRFWYSFTHARKCALQHAKEREGGTHP